MDFAYTAAATVFAFGLVAFGFLGMGPVTIAVDSYGPVTDNAQSVYELSTVEGMPGIEEEIEKDFRFKPNFEKAKAYLEENDGAGNTFKATAKPVLIGTAVVGAATMIFALIMLLTDGLKSSEVSHLSMIHPPFLLGLITGGAVIYWFTGASTQAVSTGAYRAVEYIKANIKLDGTSTKASTEDSNKVVEICTLYAQKGMWNIFMVVFFSTLSFACIDPYFFIGYLISMALFGLYQAIFMANAGGAWDNAKKIVETELRAKGTDLHAATHRRRHGRRPVQGHVVGRAQPGDQVHDAVRRARGRPRARAPPEDARSQGRHGRARRGPAVDGHRPLRDCRRGARGIDVLRVALVLPHADQRRAGRDQGVVSLSLRSCFEAGRSGALFSFRRYTAAWPT